MPAKKTPDAPVTPDATPAKDTVAVAVPHSGVLKVKWGGIRTSTYPVESGVVQVPTGDVARFINAVPGAAVADKE